MIDDIEAKFFLRRTNIGNQQELGMLCLQIVLEGMRVFKPGPALGKI